MKNYGKRLVFIVLCGMLLVGTGCGKERKETAEAPLPETRHRAIKRTYDGRDSVRTSGGHRWIPPVGSWEDREGYIYDREGAVIGFTGSVRYNPNAQG